MSKEEAVKYYEISRDYLTGKIKQMQESLVRRLESLAEDAKKGYSIAGAVGSIAVAQAELDSSKCELEKINEAIRIVSNIK